MRETDEMIGARDYLFTYGKIIGHLGKRCMLLSFVRPNGISKFVPLAPEISL